MENDFGCTCFKISTKQICLKMNYLRITTFFLLVFCLTSCIVSKKKFDAEAVQRSNYQIKAYELEKEIKNLKAELAKVNSKIDLKDGQIEDLKNQKAVLSAGKGDLSNQLNSIQRQITDFRQENMDLKQQKADLHSQLGELMNNSLSQKQQQDAALKAKIAELERKEKMIDELQATVQNQDQAMRNILTKVENAIQSYNSDDLSVEMRNGKVYIALSNALLFESGSAKIDKAGKDALGLVASILEKNPNINIIVEGHTDNVPFNGGTLKDNWDLSVVRATSVVRILTKDYGLSPNQVTPSGKGEFSPKDTNETKEGRAINRRIEIIIEPRLDEIYRLAKSNS